MQKIVLITGVSGAGKSVALKVLEDSGFYCVDNLPAAFLSELVAHLREQGEEQVAVAIDARSGASVAELPHIIAGLRTYGADVRMMFLTASTPELVRRYSETRRRHPLSPTAIGVDADSTPSLIEAIERERDVVGKLAQYGLIVDTTALSAPKLRHWVSDFVGREWTGLTLMFQSFGFKRGLPLDADMVFDLRPLPNPFYDPSLRTLTGRDRPVIDFLESVPDALRLADDIERFVRNWLPAFVRDQRSYLTVAIGCTGGQHRSVWCCERLAKALAAEVPHVIVRHRELG
ncbi:RNase adapter RapZ [Derxia lacustris]|uniref:RNase adapter RapZ n=1 Tax=Derxia lacustris TaxID=764842 RepID=UPI000A1706DA|nr:RNase adapter RapZ [Derxia lacustris]